MTESRNPVLDGVAIIGMGGRFPGARNVAEFWKNQLAGIESISHFTVEELEVPDAVELSRHPNYVRARSILEDVDLFDAEFFGMYPREAELMDPQQRLFLEVCWTALEDAGCDPFAYPGAIGVYGGNSVSTYFLSRLCADPDFIRRFTGAYQVGNYPEMMGNNVDFLATRVSYKLNLRGPAFTLQAGCSTSLLAVCQACQSLLTYQSDMALAGGSSITFPQKRGSFYQDGGMVSPDGHCRAFDADAQGTVFGSGVAVVLLKRMEDALRDGDHIYAAIRGFGVNNDGAAKVGYTAPSVEGQARVIAMAQETAGVDPRTIGYIEAHGTGTPLGDPIELAALTQAFRTRTSDKQFCAVGTAKANVGHLDIAAGVTGLIHATHVVRHGILPPTLYFHKPNPNFDMASSPFYVNATLQEWKTAEGPRRAGVSAFGVGGTNAHVVLEEVPPTLSAPSQQPVELLVLSARSESALEAATANLAAHLESHPGSNLADVAATLQSGRRAFPCRRTVVARDVPDAISALSQRDRKRVQTRLKPDENPPVYFLFPGQGSQYPNMAREIYASQPLFRKTLDRCAEILGPYLHADLRELLYPGDDVSAEARRRVTDTIVAQPAIFSIEYALAQLWLSWGIRPQAMLGHSIGEFVAATLAGVFSLEDALSLVAERGRMMQGLPAGGMLSVRLGESDVRSRLNGQANGQLALAAVNAPSLCVVAGPLDAIASFEQRLAGESVPFRRLVTSHAFHSSMMDPIVEPFTARAAQAHLQPPRIPYVSGVTGTWITDAEATDPAYWARHFRQPVQFSAGIIELLKHPSAVLLEVGPGNVLGTLSRQHGMDVAKRTIASSLSDGFSGEGDAASLFTAVGALWLAGCKPDWSTIHAGEQRQRVSLPTYPFERKRFWLELPATAAVAAAVIATAAPSPSTFTEGAAPANFATPGINTQSDVSPSSASTIREEISPVSPSIETLAAASNATSRPVKIRSILNEIFEDLSGVDTSQADGAASFLELGFDSLFLTQVTQSLQSKFDLKITFRQLLGNLGSLDALSEYIDCKLPADQLQEPAQPPAPVQAAASTFAPLMESPTATAPVYAAGTPSASAGEYGDVNMSESPVERLMREQLQAMNQLFTRQLEAIRGGAPGAPAPVPASATVAPANPAPVVSSAPATPKVAPPAPAPSATAATAAPAGHGDAGEFKPFGPYKPPQKGISGELTPAQEKGLQSLVERYTKRTAKSKAMTEQYRAALADPRVVMGFRQQWKELVYPINTIYSKGSKLMDVDGNEYIDILNGFGPIMLGHRPDFVEAAIEHQLHEGMEIGPQTPLAGEVAQMFCKMTGNERMTFCNTGSEAVMAAIRVARTVTGRTKVVLFAGAYHGQTDEVLVKGHKKAGVPQSTPVAPGIPKEKVANVTVLDYGTPESLEWIRANAKELAAVLVEPVQSRHPHLQPVAFLKEIRSITENSGTALIFDEVVTGFRVHQGGCQALFGIRGDLATYGKVLAGGMPVGVLAGKREYMDALDGGAWQFGDASFPEVGVTFFAGTFIRHPLALAAVRAVLQHFEQQGPSLQENLTANTTRMVGAINEFLEANNAPTRLESFGSIFYFAVPPEERFASLFYYYLRLKGVNVLEGFPCFLTTAHSEADIERIIQVFKESVVEMQEAGFFPPPPGTGAPREIPSEPVAVEFFASSAAGFAPELNASRTSAAAPMSEAPASEAAPPAPVAVAAPVLQEAATPIPGPSDSPLTEPQLEIFLSAQIDSEASTSYNESFTLKMRGPFNEAAFRDSLRDLVNRHQALRATFAASGERIAFAASANIDIPLEDLSSLAPAEGDARVRSAIDSEGRTPFDLVNGPVLRLRLFRREPESHALVFTSHHIVCDGWSINVLLDELSQLYSARVNHSRVDLPVPVQFGDYARTQAANRETADFAGVESYWMQQFAELPPVLDLPTDRPHPAVKTFQGSTYRTRIDADTYKLIKQAGAKQGCTLFSTLLGSFAALLHRLSGQDDIVIGIPTAGQSMLDDGTLVGHCVNFLPIRAHITENQTAGDLLKQTKRTVLDAYEHQTYTYGTLVRKLKVRRDPSRLPLIEVQFNLEKVGAGLAFSGLDVEVDPNPKTAVNFDLFLNIGESDQGLQLDCDYNTELFDRETLGRWLRHYETLLRSIAADATQGVDRLPLLTDAERHQIVFDANKTAADYPLSTPVHQIIEEQAVRTPEATAASFEHQNITYFDLDRRANQLARHLIQLGVRPGSLVGICVQRSLDMLVGILGIWKAGAAYLPLDPAYPPERLTYIMQESSIAVLLTQARLAVGLPISNTRVIPLDSDWDLIGRESKTSPNVVMNSESGAYTIYTSGSTGKPKGVEITHRNLANLLFSMRHAPGLTASDRLLAVTTLSFDIAGLELFLPLITGAQVVIASREETMDGDRLLARMRDSGATVMQATPSTWRLLLEAGWTGTPKLKILCGGEALPRDLADQLQKCGEVWNMYGPTETTIWSATSVVEAGPGPVTIGPPIHNTQFYVLDKFNAPLPVGVPGELFISGDGVARGYYKRPDLTAERFVVDPFNSLPGQRMYRTGDLVRYLASGRFEFLGRLDNQVKVRGFRIELGEIEAVLAQYSAIKESVVVAREDEPGQKRLVAYVVADESRRPSVNDLRNLVGRALPEYMIPSVFVFLAALPRTPNGKIDRKSLPAPDADHLAARETFVAPRTPRETQLAAIAGEVLHLDRVNVQASLFDLGADSLHMFQIIARAGRAGIVITAQQVFRLRTVAALASASLAVPGAADSSPSGTSDAAKVTAAPKPALPDIVPVSREQYRLRPTTTFRR
ncbi:MAG: amino acid adenylation domain-containing protein [Candidatus Acidiferrales bacterium]